MRSLTLQHSTTAHEDEAVRRAGVSRAVKALEINMQNPYQRRVRTFLMPMLNFSADTLEELISWPMDSDYSFTFESVAGELVPVTLSPLLLNKFTDTGLWKNVTAAQLESFIAVPFKADHYPCHTQTVEMNVKLTTQVVGQLMGNQRQVGQGLAITENLQILADIHTHRVLR